MKILALATLALSTFAHAATIHKVTGNVTTADTLNYSYGDGCVWSVSESSVSATLPLTPTGHAIDACDVLETGGFFTTQIPSNATILGIQVTLGAESFSAAKGVTIPVTVQIGQPGQAAGTAKQVVATSTGTLFTLGSASDTWGTNFLPYQANNLTVRITAPGPNSASPAPVAATLGVGGQDTVTVTYSTP